MEAYAAQCGLAFGLAWVLTRVAIVVARHFRFLDWPDKTRKLHPHATPLLGGVAVCLSVSLTLLAGHLLEWNHLFVDPHSAQFVLPLLVSTALLCAVGVWDDGKGMKAWHKFVWQILAVLPFVLLRQPAETAEIFGWHLAVDEKWIPLTVLWLVACTNFVNLVDGLDGLASTVTLIVTATVGVLSIVNQQAAVPVIALTLAGALIGFLCHNWPPARIFLGDSGSLPLGFLAGALALEGSAKKAAGVALVMPLVLLSVPMFDTTMAILRRKLMGRGIGQGDRAHIHHCLRDRGLTPQQTLLTLGGLCLAMSTAVVLSAVSENDWIAVVACAGILGALIVAKVFGFHETMLLGRHFTATWSLLQALPVGLRTRFVLARFGPASGQPWQEFWTQLIREVKRRNGRSLELVCVEPNGLERPCLAWTSETTAGNGPHWELQCRVPREGSELLVRASGAMYSRRSPALQDLLDLLTAFGQAAPVDLAEPPSTLPGRWTEPATPARDAA